VFFFDTFLGEMFFSMLTSLAAAYRVYPVTWLCIRWSKNHRNH